jgi:hypothetical protein
MKRLLVFLIVYLIYGSNVHSQTIWNNGSFTFTKTAAGQQDCITAQTCLTRVTVPYNSVCQTVSGFQGCSYAGPCNTQWALGSISNWNTLSYGNFFITNGCDPSFGLPKTYVVHLLNENIYLEITFTYWQSGGSNFSYTRTTGPSTCSGIPNPGNTIASANPVCPGVNFTLSLQNQVTGTGVSYQWQSSNNNINFANISGATSPTLTISQSAQTYYHCIVSCTNGNTSASSSSLSVTLCYITLNLKLYIEGFYLGGGLMSASVNPVTFPTLCDTIIVALHNVTPPYATVDSRKGILSTSGILSVSIPQGFSGNPYYLAIKHRSAVETWSSSPVALSSITNYDFSNAVSKAFGNHQLNLGDGNFAFYSGDISDAALGLGFKDGVVESQDYLDMENAVSAITIGYTPADLTGDGVVESSDYTIMENNVNAIIFTIHP